MLAESVDSWQHGRLICMLSRVWASGVNYFCADGLCSIGFWFASCRLRCVAHLAFKLRLPFSLVFVLTMLLASSITEHICLFLDDLRPLSCSASGFVTETDWRMKAEQLWPGATTNLPGDPKSQVLAFRGLTPTFCAPFQRLDHSRVLPPGGKLC